MEKIIPEQEPDVILFQEVIFESIDLIKNTLKKYGYNYFTDDSYNQLRLYGELIVSKFPIKNPTFIFYQNTIMGRGINTVENNYKNKNILLLTTHLESLPKYKFARQKQLNYIYNLIRNQDNIHNVILTGDMNMLDNEQYPDWDLIDVWEKIGNIHNKYTYYGNRFWGNEYKNRYDRILYKGENISCTNIELVGDAKMVNSDIYPSDHNGIIASFIIS